MDELLSIIILLKMKTFLYMPHIMSKTLSLEYFDIIRNNDSILAILFLGSKVLPGSQAPKHQNLDNK